MSGTNHESSTVASSQRLLRKCAEDIDVILVVGLTGAGKSYFISSIAGEGAASVGDDLESHTEKCEVIATQIGRKKVLLIDTPGFNDTDYQKNSDVTILADIAKVLAKQYELGASLRGVIYIHNILNKRYEGTAVKNLLMFQKIVGDSNLENVILTTAQWSEVKEADGARRENELRSKFWRLMMAKGSSMARYHGDRDSAVAIVSQLLGKRGVVLDLQKELASGKRLEETSAGAVVSENLVDLQRMLQKEREEAETLRRESQADKDMLAAMQKTLEDNTVRLAQTSVDRETLKTDIQKEVRAEWEQKFNQVEREEAKAKKAKVGAGVAGVAGVAIHFIMALFGIPVDFSSIVEDWF